MLDLTRLDDRLAAVAFGDGPRGLVEARLAVSAFEKVGRVRFDGVDQAAGADTDQAERRGGQLAVQHGGRGLEQAIGPGCRHRQRMAAGDDAKPGRLQLQDDDTGGEALFRKPDRDPLAQSLQRFA